VPTQIIPAPPDRDPADLARRLRLRQREPIDTTPADSPPDLKGGDRLRLWVIRDNDGGRQIPAVVRRLSENAVWIFDETAQFDPDRLDASVAEFETRIWPGVMGSGLVGTFEIRIGFRIPPQYMRSRK